MDNSNSLDIVLIRSTLDLMARKSVKWWELETKSSPKTLARAKRAREKANLDPEKVEKRKKYLKEYREKNREETKQKHIIFRYKVLSLYSNNQKPSCACCGEDEINFLSLDHIDGGGTQERKKLNSRGGNSFFFYLKKLGFPKGFQVLCHNCNMAKGIYKTCPHQLKK